jgi:hypothetical protein
MPRGIKRTPAQARAIDLTTAGACIDVALRVQRTRWLAGDEAGAEVAHQVARSIQEELLKGVRQAAGGRDVDAWY